MRIRIGVALIPMLLALGILELVRLEWIPNYLYTTSIRYDLPGLALRVGGLLSLIGCLIVLLLYWSARRMERTRLQEQEVQSSIRRDFLRRLDHELKNP